MTDPVITAERARCVAMLANDAPALDALLDEQLHFVHATGSVDDKAAYLAKMAAARIDYLSIDWSEQKIISLSADVALLTGRMTSKVRVEGVEKRLDNRVLAVWSKGNGTWRMIAFEPTPMKEAVLF